MLKELLKEERKAKVHANAAHAMKLAFIEQLGNFDLPLEEWERIMHRLELAGAKLEGRHDALWELLRIVPDEAYNVDANYHRMKDSAFKYFVLACKMEEEMIA